MAIWRDVFYQCDKCGNIVMKFGTQGATPSCCGAEMKALEPYTEDNPGNASAEKHLPVMKRGPIITITVESRAKMPSRMNTKSPDMLWEMAFFPFNVLSPPSL